MLQRRQCTALVAAVILLAVSPDIGAQGSHRVTDVQIEGNRVATESLILGVSSIQKGSELTPTTVSETIRRLYGLGIFSDVQVEAEETADGVRVYIVVDELPKLAGLKFSGNKKIKTKEFSEKLGLVAGGYISPYLINLKLRQIEDMYAAKGYFRAKVEPKLEYNSDSTEAILTYGIHERSKVKVERVVLTGNERVPDGDVIGKMRNRKRGLFRTSDFAQDEYEEDLAKVIAAFHNLGYIDAYLVSDSMSIDTSRARMTIFLHVYEGPRYYFGETEFKHNSELSSENLTKKLKFTEGDVFKLDKYDESRQELYSAYWDIGYLHARILDERTTRSDSIIDITYEMTEGLPSHVRLVKIIGNYKTKDKVIRREILMAPGQIFNRSLLLRSVRDVMALNYFSGVEPVPVDLPSGDVDIEFKVDEKPTGQVMASAGYNSQDRLVGTVGMGIPNFRGMGQNLSFSIDFGSRRNSMSVSFLEPWLFGRPTTLGLSAYTTNRVWFGDYTEGRRGGSVRLGRRLRWPDNYFRLYTSYRLERNRFFDFDDGFIQQSSYKASYYYDDGVDSRQDLYLGGRAYGPYPNSLVSFDEKWLTSSSISFTVIRDSRNLPEFATKGSTISYSFENTGGIMGGFWKYQKHTFSIAKFVPLIWKFAIAAKVQYGVVASTAGDERILVSDRFTPGGTAFDGIVRGYDDGSLTPDSLVNQSDTVYYYLDPNRIVGVDPPDDTVLASFRTRVRGKYMLVGNFELQFPIISQQIYGLLFFDAGNSWLYRDHIKPLSGLYRGWGFGFRMLIPGMGTLGFDFGRPLDDPPDGDKRSWKPHFQIGTTFR